MPTSLVIKNATVDILLLNKRLSILLLKVLKPNAISFFLMVNLYLYRLLDLNIGKGIELQ